MFFVKLQSRAVNRLLVLLFSAIKNNSNLHGCFLMNFSFPIQSLTHVPVLPVGTMPSAETYRLPISVTFAHVYQALQEHDVKQVI